MSESLSNLLGKRQNNEPHEFEVIRQFIKERFNAKPKLSTNKSSIIISVNGAALAGSLRLVLHELEEQCQTSKKLIIRIS